MDNLIFKSRDELIQVHPSEIVYFQADKNNITPNSLSTREFHSYPLKQFLLQILQ
jgi:hypothetical protein